MILGDGFVENFANGAVDFMVHFQDVCLADSAYLALLYHFEHAVQLYLFQIIIIIILLWCQFYVLWVSSSALRLLVILHDEVCSGGAHLKYLTGAADGKAKFYGFDQFVFPLVFDLLILANIVYSGLGATHGLYFVHLSFLIFFLNSDGNCLRF